MTPFAVADREEGAPQDGGRGRLRRGMAALAAVTWFIVTHPLSRRRRIANLWRFGTFQLRSFLTSAPQTFPFVNGSRLHATRGQTGATGHLYVGLQEFDDMAFVAHALRPGDVFADIGANIGAYTILAAAGAGARVVAFEPVPATRASLARNVVLNRLDGLVEIRSECVGAVTGSVDVTTGLGTANHALSKVAWAGPRNLAQFQGEAKPDGVGFPTQSGLGPGPATDENRPADKRRDGVRRPETPSPDHPASPDGTVRVPMTTLDAIFACETPAVVKIDVEGYETLVVRGGENVLRRPGVLAIVVEVNGSGARFGFADDRLLEALTRLGYSPCAYRPFERRLVPAAPSAARTSDNVILVRDPAAMQRRLTEAPRLVVRGERL